MCKGFVSGCECLFIVYTNALHINGDSCRKDISLIGIVSLKEIIFFEVLIYNSAVLSVCKSSILAKVFAAKYNGCSEEKNDEYLPWAS
jgi:hypothetical protein